VTVFLVIFFICFVVVLVGIDAARHGQHPSVRCAETLRRELQPTPEEEASRFYRRGNTYNAIGGLKGTHALALAWAIMVVFPLFVLLRIGEASYERFKGSDVAAQSTTVAAQPTTQPVVPQPPESANAVPAGWYEDPARPGEFRWWDGTAWSIRDTEYPLS
jgi:Protein of unknown function (DUF2510)